MGDGARIDDGDVRTFFEGDDSILPLFEGIDKSLRLELVHFTSECGHGNGRHNFLKSGQLDLPPDPHLFFNDDKRPQYPFDLSCSPQTQ